MPTFKPPAPPFISARYRGGKQTPKAIVMHGTVSSDNPGTARNIAKWWQGPTSPKSSCHYVVDPRETIQCVGDHTVAYHCGHNTGSIGVELCDEQAGPASRWSDADSQAIIKRAARLVAELCLAYGISPVRPSIADLKRKGPHGIYGHNDSRLAFGGTSHTDPRDFSWAQFLKLVKVEIAAVKRGAKVKPPKPATVTSDVRFVIANVKSNPLMSTARAREDYDLAFAGAKRKGAQSVYINEYHRSYASVLAASAKAHGYKVRSTNLASGLAIATRATGWKMSGLAFSLLAGGISRISPNRGVLRVGETTPAGTRVVWDCLMLPRGWNNPKYAGYTKTSAMAWTIFAKLKPIVANQTGSLKSVAVVGGDVNQGAEIDWERHLGLKPAATLVCPGSALDKMMQAAVLVPAGATAEVVEETNLGKENTDHGILYGHVRVTRPR